MRNDTNWIIAGLAAAVLLPVLALVGVPFWIAAIIAAVAFAGLVVFLAPKQLFEGAEFDGVDKGTRDLARQLVTEATPVAARLDAARFRVDAPLVRHKLAQLSRISDDILGRLKAEPQKAETVRRFMTYYLPKAAELAEGYALVETKKTEEPARLAEIAAIIDKLEQAFVHYADGLTEADLGSLDTDLAEIDKSMNEDIGR